MAGRAMARILLTLIGFYRRGISPLLPRSCRFMPSCSAYAEEAVRRHGAARGAWLAARRLARCHPWGGSGYDPVPGTLPRHEKQDPPGSKKR
ncbi:MAG TPA: membrane protein insertion efficiency factor YidD [Longimicrobiales bacterium]|nr:membrane protein insertion efficiency factor YidD [Longimicrobiales bacterium]